MKIKNSLSETLNLCAFAPLRETNSYFHSPTPVFVSRNLAERSHRVGAKEQRKKLFIRLHLRLSAFICG
jgi:hypothetical protein